MAIPSRASIVVVYAVPSRDSRSLASRRRFSSSVRSSVRHRQITPRPCVAMKLIASGVANSAAMVRSPSFSRSGASTTTTNLPARKSSSASSIVAKAAVRSWSSIGLIVLARDEALDVLREDVDLEVDLVAGRSVRES